MQKSYLKIIIFTLFSFSFLNASTNYFGKLEVTSMIDNLSITIDEKPVGIINKNKKFVYEFKTLKGSGDFGHHKIIFHKNIDEEKEYYLKTTSYFSENDLKNREINRIDLITDDFNQGYKTTYERVKIRTKPEILLKKSGLIEEIKLQHNTSYFMTKDKENLYVLSKGSSTLYEKSKIEKDAEYLEIYDLKTLKLKNHIKIGENKTTFGLYSSIYVDENNLYLGTYSGYVISISKENIENFNLNNKLKNSEIDVKVNKIKSIDGYLFVLYENGNFKVYKENKYLYTIKTKDFVKTDDYKLDSNKFGSLFDIEFKDNVVYISNDLGIIYTFRFENEKISFINAIETAEFDSQKDLDIADDINSMEFYKDNLLFSREYRGLNSYDTNKSEISFEKKGLFPTNIKYSEILKEHIDLTKTTDIYKMLMFKDNLIFTEGKDKIFIYSLIKNEIIHTFEGLSDDVFELIIDENRLISLGSDGKIYIWDLNIIFNPQN